MKTRELSSNREVKRIEKNLGMLMIYLFTLRGYLDMLPRGLASKAAFGPCLRRLNRIEISSILPTSEILTFRGK